MSRLAPYLGIIIAILFGFSIATAIRSSQTDRSELLAQTPIFEIPAIELLPVDSTGESSDNATNNAETSKSTESKYVAKIETTATVPLPTQTFVVDQEALTVSSASIRSAIVNIICYAPSGSRIRSISGSGVFITSSGVILTNAHIAQYFLLNDRNVACKIRTGSPATDAYEAALIYIPPEWIKANSDVLTKHSPSGTGEYDFAFLAITKLSNNSRQKSLPKYFPFVPLAVSPPVTGTPIVIGTYGAQFLESSQVQSSLFPTIVYGSVKDIFTYASTTIDVVSLGGSAAAQEGSSGGGVTDSSGELVAVITTSTTMGETSTRSLSAITASYIRAEYAKETGEALDLLLSRSTSESIAGFAPKIPALESVITAQLQ